MVRPLLTTPYAEILPTLLTPPYGLPICMVTADMSGQTESASNSVSLRIVPIAIVDHHCRLQDSFTLKALRKFPPQSLFRGRRMRRHDFLSFEGFSPLDQSWDLSHLLPSFLLLFLSELGHLLLVLSLRLLHPTKDPSVPLRAQSPEKPRHTRTFRAATTG